jgi:hypothetical protein
MRGESLTDMKDQMQYDMAKQSSAPSPRDLSVVTDILELKGLDPILDKFLYSAVEEQVKIPIRRTRIGMISGKEEEYIDNETATVYRKLPTEERIISCVMFGQKCDVRNFIPSYSSTYAVDPGIFKGYVVIYQDRQPDRKAIREFIEHYKEAHNKNELNVDNVLAMAQWLTWSPMLKSRTGFDNVKSSIKAKISPLKATAISSKKPEEMRNDAVDGATAIVKDMIVRHRAYGFDNDPTTIIRVIDVFTDIFEAAESRALYGTTLKGILANIEEKILRIQADNQQERTADESLSRRIIKR